MTKSRTVDICRPLSSFVAFARELVKDRGIFDANETVVACDRPPRPASSQGR